MSLYLYCDGNEINTKVIGDIEFCIGDVFVVTKGFDGSLFLFSGNAYEQFEAMLATVPKKKPDKRMLIRFFIASATDISIDEMNHLNIPQSLLKFAHIEEAAVIEGNGDFAQIWSEKDWREGLSMKDMEILKKRLK
ncbi:MAG: division/cell wall cluster transcriptional repressor MraZ [Butyrivibrio sp.]|nr:division/cell wall cluster transcriptional repressor MraZ [Butyrivibrio sp.]